MQDNLREEVKQYIEQNGISQVKLSKEAGVSTTVINRWLQGTYEGDNRTLSETMQAWLNAQKEATRQSLPDGPGFIETPTAIQIINTLRYGQMAADMVTIYGQAGVGKTTAMRHYAQQTPNAWYLVASPALNTTTAVLQSVARVCRIRDAITGRSSAYVMEVVLERLQDTKGLLIVDEAQHLNIQSLEVLRSLHDQAAIGLALSGNELVYSLISGGQRQAAFAQLYSRIGKRLALKSRVADVTALAKGWNLNNGALNPIKKIAQEPGHLRAVNKTLRLASMLARGEDAELTPRYIKAAWAELSGAEFLGNKEA